MTTRDEVIVVPEGPGVEHSSDVEIERKAEAV
jgi:hypothetical protein